MSQTNDVIHVFHIKFYHSITTVYKLIYTFCVYFDYTIHTLWYSLSFSNAIKQKINKLVEEDLTYD